MKNLLFAAAILFAVSSLAQDVYRPGDPRLVNNANRTVAGTGPIYREGDARLLSPRVGDIDPSSRHATPLAVALLDFSIPWSSGWDVYGVRLNLCLPEMSPDHHNIFGIDAGLSGENKGSAYGIFANVFNHDHGNSGGIRVSGFCNITHEQAVGIDVGAIHNRASEMIGIQTGIWNKAGEMYGLQVGLFNFAEHGGGVQIGLWNLNGSYGSPIFNLIF